MMNQIEINAKAIELRKQFGEDENSYVDVFALASQISDLTLVLYPMGDHISGVCIKNEGANLIAINSLMSYGRQRYSLALELYHLFYDDSEGVSISSKTFDSSAENEKIADCFASYFLAPYNALRSAIQKKESKLLSMRDVISLEQSFGLSHQAMLRRLVSDKFLDQEMANQLSGSVIYFAKQYGYDDKLYMPTNEEKQKRTFGNYIVQAEELKDRGIISTGKYEELLLDAFRYDIVYGEDEGGGAIDD